MVQAVPVITDDELQAMIAQDQECVLVVLDVRSSDEYDRGYDAQC